MLNRSLLIVRARQPFLDWLRSLPDPIDGDTTLDLINEDATAYLIPDYEDEDEYAAVLCEAFDPIFEHQLSGWWLDENDWPRNRTVEMFHAWFAIESHVMVEDLVDGPIVDD